MLLPLPSPQPILEYIDDEAPEDLEILATLDTLSRRSATLPPAACTPPAKTTLWNQGGKASSSD